LINGDFVEHGVALPKYEDDQRNKTWQTIKQIVKQNMDIIRTALPGKDILPTIGNNDVIVHD